MSDSPDKETVMMQHPGKRKAFFILMYCLLYGIAAVLILSDLIHRPDTPAADAPLQVETARASVDGGPWQQITLPHTFDTEQFLF